MKASSRSSTAGLADDQVLARPDDGAPDKITFGEMREMGVRGLLIYCADYRCSHSIASVVITASGRSTPPRGLLLNGNDVERGDLGLN